MDKKAVISASFFKACIPFFDKKTYKMLKAAAKKVADPSS
jgi:hypothetical protein